jgi:OFA family oxalate/formate antiporter-like MFS transporter
MTDATDGNVSDIRHEGWKVTFAGMGINLALGVLYSWSVLSSAIEKAGWGWTQTQRNLPYSIACLVFCLIMVPAGRMQDRLSPRLVATIGGLLVGAGMILASFATSPAGYAIGFGVLAGAGIGFGYASATPPAVKWFAASRTGLIAGLVVSGFGLASVYVAPLANGLIKAYSIPTAVLALGVGFLVVVVSLAQFLKAPPQGYVPGGRKTGPAGASKVVREDFGSREMLRTWQFYVMWFMYACGAGAGLMVIAVAKKLGTAQAGVLAVVTLAIGNGAGRIVAGFLSDKLGRKATFIIFFVLQAALVLLLSASAAGGSVLSGKAILATIAALVGANYGANLALFPSLTKDYYGLKNFGMNYGLVFTAWGVGGFLLAQFAGQVYDRTHSFNFAFYCSSVLLLAAAAATLCLRPPHHGAPAAAPATP